MSIPNTIQFCQDLITNPTHKSELKLGRKFLRVMLSLQNRDLEEPQLGYVEKYLSALDLPENRLKGRKVLCKKVNGFLSHLRTEYNWVEEGYYAGKGMIFGMIYGSGLGITVGSIIGGNGFALGVSMGPGIGMVIGMSVGGTMDARAKKEGRVLA
ncbi:MAG: hypothetical protein ACI9YL_001278 [Luteibaculaceae bacterium]|jgi:hypothetical protein